MSIKPNSPNPIVTLTSDFGLSDAYVAAMKLAILHRLPEATLIDVTHLVPPQDILAGSIALERAVAASDSGTVHVGVVDPGVGGHRRIIVVQICGQYAVCPDNGLITWPWRRLKKARAFELTWRPDRLSRTFHGRDLIAPAAAMLAAGRSLHEIARPIDDPILLNIRPTRRPARVGRIIHIDHFGNATTNIPRDTLPPAAAISVAGTNLGRVKRTYADVAPGKPLALVGSADLLEIAVRDGSAAKVLSLRVGNQVKTCRLNPASR
jgi:hypothetical protein